MEDSTIPTIRDRALLVDVSQGGWSPHKRDRAASEETAQRYGTDTEHVRVNKTVIVHDALKKIANHTSATDAYVRMHTSPWLEGSKGGPRILATSLYFPFTEEMHRRQEEREGLVEEFLRVYPILVEQERVSGNSTFRAEDYPAVEEMRKKFFFSVTFLPLPNTKHWMLDLSDEIATALVEQTEAAVKKVIFEGTVRDAWQRVYESVGAMLKRLREYDLKRTAGHKGIKLYDSITGNLAQLVDLLGHLNITDDQTLHQLQHRLQRELLIYEPEELRGDDEARKRAMEAAEKVLRDMSVYVGESR